jgi:hypothetical protein
MPFACAEVYETGMQPLACAFLVVKQGKETFFWSDELMPRPNLLTHHPEKS